MSVYTPYEEDDALQGCAVPLNRYAQLTQLDECAFWGVLYEGQVETGCAIWTAPERQAVALALLEAQQMIEEEVGYPLCPRWVYGTLADEPNGDQRWVDAQLYRIRQVTRYPKLIEAGQRATATIESGAAVSLAEDPATVGPIATSVTAATEVKVYFPGTSREIIPSQIFIAGGEVTISIPRCRLVKQTYWDNPATGLHYTTLENFTSTVDVVRVYTDPSVQATLVRPHCKNNACYNGCGECTQTGCIYILDPEAGVVDVRPATYGNGEWSSATPPDCGKWSRVRLNYKAGLQHLSAHAEIAILRLAHSLLAEEPCDCERTLYLWKRDRHVPELLTRERLNCPFGLSDGAWTAWKFAQSLKQYRMGVL